MYDLQALSTYLFWWCSEESKLFDNIQLYSHEVADSDDACEIFEDVPDKGSELGVKIGSSSSSRFLLPKYMTSLLALKQTVPSENIFRERWLVSN